MKTPREFIWSEPCSWTRALAGDVTSAKVGRWLLYGCDCVSPPFCFPPHLLSSSLHCSNAVNIHLPHKTCADRLFKLPVRLSGNSRLLAIMVVRVKVHTGFRLGGVCAPHPRTVPRPTLRVRQRKLQKNKLGDTGFY